MSDEERLAGDAYGMLMDLLPRYRTDNYAEVMKWVRSKFDPDPEFTLDDEFKPYFSDKPLPHPVMEKIRQQMAIPVRHCSEADCPICAEARCDD